MNHFTHKDGRVYCDVSVGVREEEDDFGQIGFISHKYPSSVWKQAKEDGKELENLPFLGNFKDFSQGANTSQAEVIEEDDDLPFD